jgi:hypothetical protein
VKAIVFKVKGTKCSGYSPSFSSVLMLPAAMFGMVDFRDVPIARVFLKENNTH